MSWLPNPFKPADQDAASADGAGTVKDDLSVIGESIGRQFRGVAAFLVPPPSPPPYRPVTDENSGDARSPRLAGVRNDLAEISGSFKSSLSLLSSNKAVMQISKLASNFLLLNDEQVDEDHGVGITEEVVDFVTEISQRPGCWTDFPLFLNDTDFKMSQAQADHISVIQQLVPTLAVLKTTLSSDLSEKQFWMIYFILLLPRLHENSLDTLSTPETVKLSTMLQNKKNKGLPNSAQDTTDNLSHTDNKLDKGHNEHGSDVAESSEASREMHQTGIKRTEKGSSEDVDTDTSDAQRLLHNEDEISFSDLEDDGSDVSTRRNSSVREQGQDAGTSPDGSSDWVRLDKNAEKVRRPSREGQPSSQSRDSEGEDWLTIDDFDDYNEAAT